MADERSNALSTMLLRQIESFSFRLTPVSVGTVTEVSDGIVHASGLADAMVNEMVRFENGALGMILNLEAESVGAVVLGPYAGIVEGTTVEALGRVVSVPVGDALLGRVVDALGRPIDDKGPMRASETRPVERIAPGVVDRLPVRVPLQTGIIAVDALVPIGRGQRELIVGDRQTGKTTLAIDAILNQRREDVLCIYVAVGQKMSSVARVVDLLDRTGALGHTVVVVAEAGAPAVLQYLAPYAGCAIGEAFMERGRDVLIVFDDLTKHAWAYRQISLLLKRPPGREAFPGDVFYLHARLLERAGHLGADLGGGSMTALPIIETQMGDLTAYIVTNVVSITDGQIYLEAELFHGGVRPAINAGLSVSRVAGAAQTPAMRAVSGQARLDLAQYRELAVFAQFGAEVDAATQRVLDRGARLVEVLKQDQHSPIAVEDQVALLYAVSRGYLDVLPVASIRPFAQQFVAFLQTSRQGLRNTIAIQRSLTPEVEQLLAEAIDGFVKREFRPA